LTPRGFDWAAQINQSFHAPHAEIDGK